MFPKAKIIRLNALHRLQEPQSNWFQNNLMTTKLAIKFVVFCRDLTLVAKYASSQPPSHLETWLQAPGGILQPGLGVPRNIRTTATIPPAGDVEHLTFTIPTFYFFTSSFFPSTKNLHATNVRQKTLLGQF